MQTKRGTKCSPLNKFSPVLAWMSYDHFDDFQTSFQSENAQRVHLELRLKTTGDNKQGSVQREQNLTASLKITKYHITFCLFN